MSRELYAVLAEASTYGTMAVYTPYTSISSDTYLLPPPTTIVGALAYAYNRSLNNFMELATGGYSPAVELVEKKKVLYAAAGIVKPITISKSIEKLYQHIYLKKPHWRKPEMAYTIGVRPVATVDKLQILLIVSDKDLVRYCYGITRLGRKESLVAVDDVVSVPLREALAEIEYCETSFYFPLSIAADYSPRDLWMEVDIPTLNKDNYAKRTAILARYVLPKPLSDTKAIVHLNKDGIALKIRRRDGVTVEVPIPRQATEL